MATYLERYTSGEYEAVWNELMALGAGVFDQPVHSDALAVARETMRRAQTNIVTILARLKEMGYEFDTTHRNEERRKSRLAGLSTMLAGLKGAWSKAV
jgi:hypothetical protein